MPWAMPIFLNLLIHIKFHGKLFCITPQSNDMQFTIELSNNFFKSCYQTIALFLNLYQEFTILFL